MVRDLSRGNSGHTVSIRGNAECDGGQFCVGYQIVPVLPCYHGRVAGAKLSVLIAVFFFTSVISVVTGSTSLITVPIMIALGIEAHVAVATNMLALTFMSVGGSLPFIGRGILSRSRLPASVALTIIGSGFGAFLLLSFSLKA